MTQPQGNHRDLFSSLLSLDAAVRIEGADRAGRARLLRKCAPKEVPLEYARPPFVLAHLHEHDAGHLLYLCPEPRPGGPSALVLTPLELIGKIAALVPPPRTHRQRYYGVLAPNARCAPASRNMRRCGRTEDEIQL